MKMKKVLCAVLALSMCFGMLTGCGKKSQDQGEAGTVTATKPEQGAGEADAAGGSSGYVIPADWDISEPVNLSIYCIGDEGGIYADDMLDHINEILKEKINATIEPVMVSWGDYNQKLPIIWASGEAYDLTYTSDWCGYFTEGIKGAFYNLDELLPKYAPKTYAEYAERGNVWDSCKINGSVYMVPAITEEWTAHAVVFREDLRKKYNCPEIVDIETLETFMDAIKENEPGMLPLNMDVGNNFLWYLFLTNQDWSRPVEHDNGIFVYDIHEGGEVFNVVETKEYEDYIKLMRKWYEKGYWSQSIMAESTALRDQFLAGKSAVNLDNTVNISSIYNKMSASSPDWELGVFDWDSSNSVAGVAPASNGMAIGLNSKNPERAMMFLELCHQDEELYDAILYGIEGETYINNGDGTTSTPPDKDASTLNGRNIGMGINDYKFVKGIQNDWPGMPALKEDWNSRTVVPALAGFYLNMDEISADLAAVRSVCDEYKLPLEKGILDPETGLAQLRQKLKEVDAERLEEEINKQIGDYKNSQK